MRNLNFREIVPLRSGPPLSGFNHIVTSPAAILRLRNVKLG
jgi:hypothetical protein